MKRMGLIMSVAALLLLAACGAKPPAEHSGHGAAAGQQDRGKHTDGHGGHSGHGEQKADVPVKAVWSFSKEKPQPNEQMTLTLQINDTTGKPIEGFDISHEKKLHLIVVSKDLSYFDHLHPEYRGTGQFVVSTKLPRDGAYKLIADFIPSGAAQKTETHWLEVGNVSQATVAAVEPESQLKKTVNGKEVTLAFDKLQAGHDVQMTFSFKDEASGKPITNLQPYLGAVGHVVIMSSDVEQYIHNHPLDEKASGPDAVFGTSFPVSGVYKIWGQFQHQGESFLVPFVVKVP
ncbi:hypothetical protein [Paenibacillus sp. YYML68]|uniref:hypothetical protein n=1 Tax=Paenibacillus sp. YYML68 TaxID=2909250 RepID=UPI00249051AC|nr:hypothetical protein [Paenibacillus sp. YYML68]